MALILNEKYNTNDKIIVFYKNRLLKLFPIYWTILIITLLIFLYLYLNKGGALRHIIDNIDKSGFFSLYILLSNVFLIGEDLLMFLGFDGDSIVFTKSFLDTNMPFHKFIIIPQSWTLSLEIMFYLMAPFVARRSIKFLICLFSISMIIKIKLWSAGLSNDPWSYRFILSELSFFFIGMIMYKVYKFGLYSKFINNKILFFIGLLLFFTSGFFYFNLKDILMFNGIDLLKYIIYFLFIIFLPLFFVQTKDIKKDRYIGELSYPIYIIHALVIMVVHKIANGTILSLFAILGSILLSIILNKTIQEKVEKIRIKNISNKG
ncbi:acyltransferase [Campylobacter sp. 7477a]|nr:acyltransferase [Campylobacter sp. 7477a]